MLQEAFKNNDTEKCLEYLKVEGINVHKEDKDGWTLLGWASFHGNDRLVKVLLQEKQAASSWIKDKEEEKLDIDEEEEDDPFKKPMVAS